MEEEPNIVNLEDETEIFGEVKEITSRASGAERANVSKVTLWGADLLHHHEIGEETYVCMEGCGEIFLDEEIGEFIPGQRVIIRPGAVHGVRPKESFGCAVFLCVSAPAFDPKDVFADGRGRQW